MKKITKSLPLLFIFTLLFTSCSKDENKESLTETKTEITSRSDKETKGYNFFNYNYVKTILDIRTSDDGYYPELEDAIHYLDLRNDSIHQIDWLMDQDLYPCWSCAEPEFEIFRNSPTSDSELNNIVKRFLTPIYKITTGELQSVLISEEVEGQFTFYYFLPERYFNEEPIPETSVLEYWKGVEGYFNIQTGYNNTDGVFASRLIPCKRSNTTGWCWCKVDGENFSCTLSSIDKNCAPSCNGLGGGSSGGNGTGDPTNSNDSVSDIGVQGWEVFNPTGNGGDSSSSGSNDIDDNGELDILDDILFYLQEEIAEDGTINGLTINEISILLASNPILYHKLDEYIRGELGVTPLTQTIIDFIDLINITEGGIPTFSFTNAELDHLLAVHPELMPRITSFFYSQGISDFTGKIVRQFLNLELATNQLFPHSRAVNWISVLNQSFDPSQQEWVDNNGAVRNLIYRKYIETERAIGQPVLASLVDLLKDNPELSLTLDDDEYLLDNPNILAEVIDFINYSILIEKNKISSVSVKLSRTQFPSLISNYSISLLHSNLALFSEHLNNLNEEWPIIGSTSLASTTAVEIIQEVSMLRVSHPEWSSYRLLLNAIINVHTGNVHTGLDILGLVPGLGEIADITNGVLYTIQGDGYNATISFAASVPFLGWTATGAKYAGIVVKINDRAHKLKLVKNINGLIEFGSKSNSKLRSILNITDPLLDAHHIIPWKKCWDHPVIQAAAKNGTSGLENGIQYVKKTFHMDMPSNGIPVSKFRRSQVNPGQHANHPSYDNRVLQKLDDLITEYGPDIDPSTAFDEISELMNEIRQVIIANPNMKINDIII